MGKVDELKSSLDLMKSGIDDAFYREELIFWESNAQKSLALNKKESISFLIKGLVAKFLRKGIDGKVVKSTNQMKTKLKINFSNDLNEEVKNYSEEDIKHSLEYLGVVLSKYSHAITDIELTNSSQKVRAMIRLQIDREDKNIDIDFSLLRDEFNSISQERRLGHMKCYKTKEENSVLVYVDFENAKVKNKSNDKTSRNMERQYEV